MKRQRKRFEDHGNASFSIPLHPWHSTSTGIRAVMKEAGGEREREREGKTFSRQLADAEAFTASGSGRTANGEFLFFFMYLKGSDSRHSSKCIFTTSFKKNFEMQQFCFLSQSEVRSLLAKKSNVSLCLA